MLPTTPEVLRSMRYSIATYLLPHIEDPWATYVAKAMQRMVELLERRYELEGPFLVEDSAELVTLFASLRDRAQQNGVNSAELIAALDEESTDSDADHYVALDVLNARNQALRARLVSVIRSLDDLEDGPDCGDVDPLRREIREYLGRQLDRDVRISEPSFMTFAPRATDQS